MQCFVLRTALYVRVVSQCSAGTIHLTNLRRLQGWADKALCGKTIQCGLDKYFGDLTALQYTTAACSRDPASHAVVAQASNDQSFSMRACAGYTLHEPIGVAGRQSVIQ